LQTNLRAVSSSYPPTNQPQGSGLAHFKNDAHALQDEPSNICREITDAVKNRSRVSFEQTLITSDRISAARLDRPSGFLLVPTFLAAQLSAPRSGAVCGVPRDDPGAVDG
jgi:hypothetical protein